MRGPRKLCACGRTHWSVGTDLCPYCRNTDHAKEVLKFGKRSRRQAGTPSNSIVWERRGHCLVHRMCHVHWRHLDHRHCGCSRPMAAHAKQCGACTALELLEGQLPRQELAGGERYADVEDPALAMIADFQFGRVAS